MNSSRIILNCSANFSSLRIEDPKRGPNSVEETANLTQKFLLSAIPEISKNFILEGKIGEGTFSKVYKARLVADKSKEFALKYVIPTIKPSRVATELRYLRDLGGSCNVVPVLMSFLSRGHSVIVMPFFPHHKFSDYVSKLTVPEIKDYMKQLFLALQRVHSMRVIHRDVKPSNFLYNRTLKKYALVDFGLAQNEKELLRSAKAANAQRVGHNPRTALRESSKASANNTLVKPDPKVFMIRKRARSDSKDKTRAFKKHRPNDEVSSKGIAPVKSSVFNTPLTPSTVPVPTVVHPNDNCSANENMPFKTPTKAVYHKTPVKASPTTIIPETPPKTIKSIRLRGQNVGPKALITAKQASIVDTPKGNYREKGSSPTEKACDCMGREQVCRDCTKRSECYAPRAGTPGFRAPEVLLKHMQQTTAIDVWSAGVIFASLLSGRYPFFRNTDDMTSLAEIATILGSKRVLRAASDLGKRVTMTAKTKPPLDLRQLLQRLRGDEKFNAPDSAYLLLDSLLEPNPRLRLTADDVLQHPFISCPHLD